LSFGQSKKFCELKQSVVLEEVQDSAAQHFCRHIDVEEHASKYNNMLQLRCCKPHRTDFMNSILDGASIDPLPLLTEYTFRHSPLGFTYFSFPSRAPKN
jgi:hypothetical protein